MLKTVPCIVVLLCKGKMKDVAAFGSHKRARAHFLNSCNDWLSFEPETSGFATCHIVGNWI